MLNRSASLAIINTRSVNLLSKDTQLVFTISYVIHLLINSLYAGKVDCFLSSADCFKLTFSSKNTFRNTIKASNSLDQDPS